MDGLPHKTFYRPDEVATIFEVSSRTVLRWKDEGTIRTFVKIGGTVRIPREEVERLSQEMTD